MPYSVLLFDYDGTLCDTRQAIYHSLRQVFRRHHAPVPTAAALDEIVTLGLPMLDTLHALHPEGPAADVAHWVAEYRAIYDAEGEPLAQPFAGAPGVLAELQTRGHGLAVVSNKSLHTLHKSLARLDLARYVSLVVGEGSLPGGTAPLKPSPAFYLEAIQPHFASTPAADMLMIGDTPSDLLFARSAGVPSCWAAYGFGDAVTCLALDPQHHIGDVRDVLELVGWN